MRILFLTHTNIGDAILSTVLLERMLHDHPDATVDVVVGAKSVDVFSQLPQLGKLIPLVKKKRHAHYIELWKKLRGIKYDYVVDLRGTFLPFFLKKKKVIRFSNANKKQHKGKQLAALYPSQKEPRQRIWVSEEQRQSMWPEIEKVKQKGPLIGFGPTANWIAKRWPQRKFALLSEMIREVPGYENAQFVLLGAEHERESISDLIRYIPEGNRVDLVGKTTLSEACVWLERLDVFIGNDSGLSHMAAAVDTPTVTIFGPTPDHLYSPMARRGEVVAAPQRDHVNLMPSAPKRIVTDVKTEHVLAALSKLLNFETTKQESAVNA